jgi:hypothetical protein
VATLQCILKYKGKKLTKTFQVLFDENDTIKILTETPSLVIKSKNTRASKLMATVKKGAGTVAHAEHSAPNEFQPPLVAGAKVSTKSAKRAKGAKGAKGANTAAQAQFRFSAPEKKMARFICGIRANGKFVAYPEGLEVPTPP